MRVGDLFAGIGGFSLGLERAGFEIAWQVELEPYCRLVLAQHWPDVSRYSDITEDHDLEPVDVICGGFPCQGISAAGRGLGLKDARSGLWWWMFHTIGKLRPRWVIIENSPRLRTRGADRALACLESEGYACWPLVVGAEHIGAPHKRHRVWVVAHAHSQQLREQRGCAGREGAASTVPCGAGEAVADAQQPGLERLRAGAGQPEVTEFRNDCTPTRWPAPPGPGQYEWEADRLVALPMGGTVDGLPARVVRRANRYAVAALGNAVMPDIPQLFGEWIQLKEGGDE